MMTIMTWIQWFVWPVANIKSTLRVSNGVHLNLARVWNVQPALPSLVRLTFIHCKEDWTLVKYSHCLKSSFFVQKIQLWFPEKKCRFFLCLKNSWKFCGFGLFSCWQLWFHEKNCQKYFEWKTRENVGVLSKLNFCTKIWLLE